MSEIKHAESSNLQSENKVHDSKASDSHKERCNMLAYNNPTHPRSQGASLALFLRSTRVAIFFDNFLYACAERLMKYDWSKD